MVRVNPSRGFQAGFSSADCPPALIPGESRYHAGMKINLRRALRGWMPPPAGPPRHARCIR